MKIATWNINSIRIRLPLLIGWLKAAQPDVLALQEIKCRDEDFPLLEIQAAGYSAAVHGQKSYNGVALLARQPLQEVRRGLPGDESDEQARYIEATVEGVRVASLYLPNGNPTGSEKFPYKLAWMARLRAQAEELLAQDRPFALCGDYNVCPGDADVYDPQAFAADALCRFESRAAFRALLHLGLTEAFGALHPAGSGRHYSFWDYQGRAWPLDHGLRIDHLLLGPQAADRLAAAGIDRGPRAEEKASDHTPVWCELT